MVSAFLVVEGCEVLSSVVTCTRRVKGECGDLPSTRRVVEVEVEGKGAKARVGVRLMAVHECRAEKSSD